MIATTDPVTIASAYAAWLNAKSTEEKAVEERRVIEDWLVSMFAIDAAKEGAINLHTSEYKVTVTPRLDRKVDAEALDAVAKEHGLTSFLPTLFRYKPEINAKEWKATDPKITNVLAQAVTTKPGRPSFKIEIKEAK